VLFTALLAVPFTVVFTVLFTALFTVGQVGPAAANVIEDDEPRLLIDPAIASLEIMDQTTFVAADGTFGLDLAIEPAAELRQAPDQYELSVTVYGRLEDEGEVAEPLTQPLNRLPPTPIAELLRSTSGYFHLDIPIRSGNAFDDQERVLLPLPGVYPVSIELRTAEGPIATARTYIVRLPQVTSEDDPPVDPDADADADNLNGAGQRPPLPVSIILNVSAAEGLTIDDVQQLLTDHPTIPLTVVLQAGVTNILRNDLERAAGFAAALGGRPALAVPAIDLDPSALAEIDQAQLYADAYAATDRELRELGLTPAQDVVLLGAPLTESGLRVLNSLGVKSVLDTESRTGGIGTLGVGSNRLRVIRFDRALSGILGGGDDGPHRANRVLARLTLRGQVDDSPVILGGATLGVDPRRSINAFLRSLTQPGAPRPTLLSEPLLSGSEAGPAIRFAERPEQDLQPITQLLQDVQAVLATYLTFYNGGGNTPAHYQQQILAGLTRQRNPEDRKRALQTLQAQFDEDLAVVSLQDGQPVTLAARSAPIPIGLESSAVGPRKVLLRFASDKVVATDDQQVVSIEPGASSINVELETRALGISPLEVSVWTPDGEVLLANTRFEIRSTAIPGFGLLVSLGAVGLLGAWWVVDARKRREALLLAADNEPPPSESNARPGSGSV
jgi:hypothetical protein